MVNILAFSIPVFSVARHVACMPQVSE